MSYIFNSTELSNFGNLLSKIRKESKLSQKKVSEICGIHIDTLRKIENGRSIPKFETLETLSIVYKTDLFILLKECCENKLLKEVYFEIDKAILASNSSELISIKSKINFNNHYHLIDPTLLTMLEIFIQETINYHNITYTDYKNSIHSLTSFLKSRIKNFTIYDLKKNKYSLLELRILLLTGLFYVKSYDFYTSNEILIFSLNALLNQTNASVEAQKLLSKIYLNIAYNFHRIDNHKEALLYCDKGIKYLLSHNLLYLLPHLYARKAVAEYHLSYDHYKNSFMNAITLFNITGEEELAKKYTLVAKNMYGFDVSNCCNF